jgi:predicted amidophosphoribosyltransferase
MVRTRPRTKLKLRRKTRRCPKCGAKLNNQQIRCKRCAAEVSLIGVAPGTRKGRFVKAYRRRRKRKLDGG